MENSQISNESIIPILTNIIKTEYNHNISELDIDIIEGGYQNLIYSYIYKGKAYIIRVSDSKVREKEMIECELEWIQYLYNSNISVSTPILSSSGNYIEDIKINNFLGFLVVFNKAIGYKLNYQEYLKDTLIFEQMGKVMGKIHNTTKNFIPEKVKRNDWINNIYIKQIENILPNNETDIISVKKELINDLSILDKNIDNYGLIHGDFNVGNFVVHNGSITLFDFDECQYSWYIEDIAIAIYYTIYPFGDEDIVERNHKAEEFMIQFLNGYLQENVISIKELKLIPYFLRLRELIVFLGCLKRWDINNLSQWQEDFYNQSKKRIKNKVSIIDNDVILSEKIMNLFKH